MDRTKLPSEPVSRERDDSGLPTWDQRILALLPPSVDPTQIAESLAMTPTERIEHLQALHDAAHALRRSGR